MRPTIGTCFIAVCLCALTGSLTGCDASGRNGPKMGISDTLATGEVIGRPQLGMPISIPGRNTAIVPFVVESPKGWFENPDPYSRGGYATGRLYENQSSSRLVRSLTDSSSVRWHNAVIKDAAGHEAPILTTRGIINRWVLLGHRPEPDAPVITDGLVFIVTTADTNKDGRLDDRDASVALLTDADGFNPHAVTPPGAQVWSVLFDAITSTVYFHVAADSNGDGSIDPTDISMPYSMKLGPGTASPVISEATRTQLEGWLK